MPNRSIERARLVADGGYRWSASGYTDANYRAAWGRQRRRVTERERAAFVAAVLRGRQAPAPASHVEYTEFRSFPAEIERNAPPGWLSGYAAVFSTRARVQDQDGDFDEVILPGAFRESLRQRTPVLMFEHGRHPMIGMLPIGVIRQAVEDTRGLHIDAELSDNWMVQPVHDAIRDGAITGMSFRLSVPQGGDRWTRQESGVQLREVSRLDCRELGPVVFPAYPATSVSVGPRLALAS